MIRHSSIYSCCSPPSYFNGGCVLFHKPRRYVRIKSLLDKVIAALLLVLTSPILLAAMIAVRLTSRGPVVYTQVRVGLNGAHFRIYKIRSMYHECENQSGPRWSQPGDDRVTRVGRFLRVSHIDKLPQLVNVLKGEMSLVGPRPEQPNFVTELENALPRYPEWLLVLPRITGLAQIQLKPDTDLRRVANKLLCDICYVQNMSALLGLQILFGTPLYLFGLSSALLCSWLCVPALRSLECTCAEGSDEFVVPVLLHASALETARS